MVFLCFKMFDTVSLLGMDKNVNRIIYKYIMRYSKNVKIPSFYILLIFLQGCILNSCRLGRKCNIFFQDKRQSGQSALEPEICHLKQIQFI